MTTLRIPSIPFKYDRIFDKIRACRSPKRILHVSGAMLILFFIYVFTEDYMPPGRGYIDDVDLFNNTFLTTNLDSGIRGGLGNILFELVVLIGISRTLGRIPYIHTNNSFALNVINQKISPYFPDLMEEIRILDKNVSVETVKFHDLKCCTFDDPERLRGSTSKFLQLDGKFFQSLKYFDHMRNSVRALLKLDEEIEEKATGKLPEADLNRFRICVHVRRTDFITVGLQVPSEEDFTRKATEFLKKKYAVRNPSAVVFGDDPDWVKGVLQGLSNVHVMEGTTTIDDLALSRKFCDAFLITATQSTFGFWLGYLAKPSADVFYADSLVHPKSVDEFTVNDFFPSQWTKLRLENSVLLEIK